LRKFLRTLKRNGRLSKGERFENKPCNPQHCMVESYQELDMDENIVQQYWHDMELFNTITIKKDVSTNEVLQVEYWSRKALFVVTAADRVIFFTESQNEAEQVMYNYLNTDQEEYEADPWDDWGKALYQGEI